MSRAPMPEGFVHIISDGMGGHKGGSEAAELTVHTLQEHLSALKDSSSIEIAIANAFVAANASVYEKGHSGNPENAGMGAAAVVCVTRHSSALIAHVGDSRAYLHRAGKLTRLTKDHTHAQKMVEAGVLSPAEAETHPDASVLARAIGQVSKIEVEIGSWLKLKAGDEVMLCSDGLSGEVDDEEILRVMQHDTSPQRTADRLVDSALRKGGHDNVTVQVLRYGSRPATRGTDSARFNAVMLAILVVACAASMYWYARTEAHMSDQMTALQAETHTLRVAAGESNQVFDTRLTALAIQVASLEAAVKELTAAKPPAVASHVAAGKKPHSRRASAALSPFSHQAAQIPAAQPAGQPTPIPTKDDDQ